MKKPGCTAFTLVATLSTILTSILLGVEVNADTSSIFRRRASSTKPHSDSVLKTIEVDPEFFMSLPPRGGTVAKKVGLLKPRKGKNKNAVVNNKKENQVAIIQDKVLIQSFRKAGSKVKDKEVQEAKMVLSAALLAASKQNGEQKASLFRMISFIIQTCLNPFALIRMTSGYFSPIVDPRDNYFRKDSSQVFQLGVEERLCVNMGE